MTKYRKKPVVIEARQVDTQDYDDLCDILKWSGASLPDHDAPGDVVMEIRTLEGAMTVSPGDYVIRGVQGEFYPCKPDIFAATYERVEETP